MAYLQSNRAREVTDLTYFKAPIVTKRNVVKLEKNYLMLASSEKPHKQLRYLLSPINRIGRSNETKATRIN